MDPRSIKRLGGRFGALWVGHTVSQLGTYIAFLTLPLLVLYIQEQSGSGSVLDFSIAYALETFPAFIVGLIGGVLLDRWHLRPVMVAADLIRATAFFYLVANLDSYGISTVFVVAFLVGSCTTFFDGALYAMIPALVPRHELPTANSLMAASQQVMFAVGPLVAGILSATTGGPGLGLFLNGLTFIASAVSLRFVGRVAKSEVVLPDPGTFLEETRRGLAHIWSEPRLRVTTIAAAVPNLVIGFVEATFVVLAGTVILTRTDTEIGILLGALGTGGLLGALLAPTLIRRLGLGRSLIAGMMLAGLGLLAVVYTNYGLLAIALQVLWMVGISVVNVPLTTIRQQYAAPGMLGRVVTAARAMGWMTLPLGALLGGWLGATEATYEGVARTMPLLIIGTAVWLLTTVLWRDTFGPAETEGSQPAPHTP